MNHQQFNNQIQDCIQHCNQVSNQLRSLANQSQDSTLRNMLTESANHMEMCIKKCEFSSQWFQNNSQATGQQQKHQQQQARSHQQANYQY